MVKNLNPFIVSGKIAPEYFCDRVKEAADLEKSIHNQMNVVLTSPRRMGKTSLVDYTSHYDLPRVYPCSWDSGFRQCGLSKCEVAQAVCHFLEVA